jgi:hypothetical protein
LARYVVSAKSGDKLPTPACAASFPTVGNIFVGEDAYCYFNAELEIYLQVILVIQ